MAKLYQRRTCAITGAYGELVKVFANGVELYRADDGTYFKRAPGKSHAKREAASPAQRAMELPPFTEWGAPIGGAPNPELLALAQRVKGRKA